MLVIKGLYVVLDSDSLGRRDPVLVARAAIRGGAKAIQYRAKSLGDAERFANCKRLARLCAEKNVSFVVNDRCDIALAVGASGVHLGHEDMPPRIARKLLGARKIVGVSSHSVPEALKLARCKPDYVAVGPVFESGTKITARRLLGAETVRRIAHKITLPVVAIGGINRHNAQSLIQAGASAVAVIAAVGNAKNPEKATRELVEPLSS